MGAGGVRAVSIEQMPEITNTGLLHDWGQSAKQKEKTIFFKVFTVLKKH